MGPEYYPEPQPGMKLLVVYQAFAVAVVILQQEIEVGLVAHSPYKIYYGIEIQVPSGTLYQRHAK